METAKANQAVMDGAEQARLDANASGKARLLRLRGLQAKLIMPYLVITLALAAIGIFIVTSLVVDSERERFNNSMIDASRVANDGMVGQEKAQLDRLRFMIFTEGAAQAMYDRNSDQIFNLMRPVLSNSSINLITAVDTGGQEIITFGKDSNTKEYHRQEGVDFSGVPAVKKALADTADDQGDKFVDLLKLGQGPILFTSAPVKDVNGRMTGVMMVGTYLDDILVNLKKQALADIILVDSQGQMIATTLTGEEEGFQSVVQLSAKVPADSKTRPQSVTLNQRAYQVAYSPLVIREQPVGWIGVIKNSDYLVSQTAKSRDLLVGVFSAGTLLVILIGYVLARDIARPILQLRSMTQAVAAGDLNQNSGLKRQDEIGELAGAFDTMTARLKDRTEEAERLYAETLQRNKELAEINARLEATQLQLIQSEKLASIGQLTAGIVHDVKNPFAVIMGMSEVLGEDDKLDEATRHGLKVIHESAVKGNTIVSDLLKFARQSKPEMRYGDLRDTVQTSLRLTAYLTRKYNTQTEIPESGILVTYDAQQIEQVLINMIHNAIQAMPNSGILRVGLRKVDDTAQIFVQDSGTGISPEHLKRIFDPFFTTKPEGEGTGLGLSVSYGIVANHRGRIDVESEVGKGTTFTIVLPITQPSLSGDTNE